MKRTMILLACGVVFLAFAVVATSEEQANRPPSAPAATKKTEFSDLKITGPHTHKNLTVFLIHGPDRIKHKEFLTLEDALKSKKIVIHETSNVSELLVENVGDIAVYIQSGEIIKGGKQDRTLQYDCVVEPRSGKQSIASFCVEQGRWSGRGHEDVTQFSSSSNMVVGKDLKLAAKLKGDQGAVWAEVGKAKEKLSENVGVPVQDDLSVSSLQLSLENPKLRAQAKEYEKAFAGLLAGKTDVIGLAVAINGTVVSVDTYACSALATKLWAKLISTSATEAIAERKADAVVKAPTDKDVRDFVAEAEKAEAQRQRISEKLMMEVRDSPNVVSFETTDEAGNKYHNSYLKK